MQYSKIDGDIVDRLKLIVGEENVLVSSEEMEPYSHDEVTELRAEPEAVVRVLTTGQVSAVMELA